MVRFRQQAFFKACSIVVFLGLFSYRSASAEVLTLNRALEQAVESSYDYKIAKVTTAISREDIQIAKADYLPQIKGYMNLERLKSLDDQQQGGTAVVGNNVLASGSRYQNAGGLQLSQTLWDFGQRSFKVRIAKSDVASRELQAEQLVRDLKLKVIEAYTDALITYQAWHTKQLIVPLYKELFKMDERLHEAGYLSKLQLSEDAIALARALDEEQSLSNQLQEHLQTLSQLTQMSYPQDVELGELDVETENNVLPNWNAEKSLEAKTYELEIDKKKKEVSLLKRQYLPQLSAYSNYNLYGSSLQGVGPAVQNLQSRSLSMGLNMNVPIFDGFRLQGQIDKARLEVERLRLEREKKLFELSKKEEHYRLQSASAEQLLITKKGWVDQVQDKLVMLQRLSEEQVVDKTKLVKETIQQIESDFEQYKLEVQKAAAAKKLEILYTS